MLLVLPVVSTCKTFIIFIFTCLFLAQNLQSLDLSGAQNISALVLCELLGSQSRLCALSLAGTLCDQRVISVVCCQCHKLKHLDVSRCLHLTPAGLAPSGLPRTPCQEHKHQQPASSGYRFSRKWERCSICSCFSPAQLTWSSEVGNGGIGTGLCSHTEQAVWGDWGVY